MKGKRCAKRPVEIYSKMYYSSQIKPDNSLDLPAQSICDLCRQLIEEKFKDEPQEILDEVMHVHSEQSNSKDDTLVEDEDQAYLVLDAETHQE